MSNPHSAPDIPKRLATIVAMYETQQAAADAAGISLSQLKRYISGQSEPSLSAVAALCAHIGASLDWLYSGKDVGHIFGWGDNHGEEITPAPADVSYLPDSWTSIPIYDANAAAGSGSENVPFPDRYYFAAEERWIRKILRRTSKHLAGVHVVGDSMAPTLYDGDIVIVDLSAQSEPIGDGIYVLHIDNYLYVKRITRKIDGKLLIHSDNGAYPVETVDPRTTAVSIYGRVVAAFHQL